MIVIIGGGLAGLTCAKCLADAGRDDFLLLEAASELGGRVATEHRDGFVLDRGFQVLLEGYPAVRRHLDLAALDLRPFDSGALLADPTGSRKVRLFNPLRHPIRALAGVARSGIAPDDLTALGAMTLEILRTPDDELVGDDGRSTLAFLRQAGISAGFVERFFRPFFGGVFLDEELATSAGLFRYYLKKFALSRASIPAGGMAAIPRQLARAIPADRIRTGTRVAGLCPDPTGSRIEAVAVEQGPAIPCRTVVLAVDPWHFGALVGANGRTPASEPPPPSRSTTVLYFTSPVSLYDDRLLVLPSTRSPLVRHFVQLTNVSAEWAPRGVSLMSATVLDERGLKEAELFARAAREIDALFPGSGALLRPLRCLRVPRALPVQEPGYRARRPGKPAWGNVLLAGDHTSHASIEGAMSSGESAARRLVESVARGA